MLANKFAILSLHSFYSNGKTSNVFGCVGDLCARSFWGWCESVTSSYGFIHMSDVSTCVVIYIASIQCNCVEFNAVWGSGVVC